MDAALTPEMLLSAYAQGVFPMADSADSDSIAWYQPPMRGQLSIDGLHVPTSLRKAVLKSEYEIKTNAAFEAVMRACAETGKGRKETWINEQIIEGFCKLNALGFAHSVEVWHDGELIGGLYGLALGGVFCGESMFSRETNASKIALVHLCARLDKGGFKVLDTQYLNPHLEQFGAYEIPHEEYLEEFGRAIGLEVDFILEGIGESALVQDYLAR